MTRDSPMQARRVYDNARISTQNRYHSDARAVVRDDGVVVTAADGDYTYPEHAIYTIQIAPAGGHVAGRPGRVTFRSGDTELHRKVTVLDDGWLRTVVPASERRDDRRKKLVSDSPPTRWRAVEWLTAADLPDGDVDADTVDLPSESVMDATPGTDSDTNSDSDTDAQL